MKIVDSYVFRAVCALLAGVLLVSNPERMTGLLVRVFGGLFLVSGLVTLVSYFVTRRAGRKRASAAPVSPAMAAERFPAAPVFPVVGVGSVLFGAWLVFFPEQFVVSLMYVSGGLMVVAGVNQSWNMFRLRRVIPFRWYALLFTSLVTGVGVFVLFNPLGSASLPFVLLGAGFMLYGVSELVNGVRWRKYGRLREGRRADAGRDEE